MPDTKAGTAALAAALFDDGAATPISGAQGAVTAYYGPVGGRPAYLVCQTGKPLGVADLALHRRMLERAAATGNPVVTVYDAPGAKLEEGQEVLKATAALADAAARLSGVVPQVAVVTGVCGASQALAAATADLCIVTEKAEMFLSSPFLSAAKGDKPAGAGTADFAARAGVAALVAPNAGKALEQAQMLLAMLPSNNLEELPQFEADEPGVWPVAGKNEDALLALADGRQVQELYAEWGNGFVTALGFVEGAPVAFVCTRSDEMIDADGADKAARFVRLADAFSLPVVTVVGAEGFAGASDDLQGGIRAAARLAGTYADATTACVAVVVGQAVGPVYSALCAADVTIAVQGAVLAPVAPTAAVAVLQKAEIEASGKNIEEETKTRAAAYAADEAGAEAALAAGLADFAPTPAETPAALRAALRMLASKRTQRLPKKHGNLAL